MLSVIGAILKLGAMVVILIAAAALFVVVLLVLLLIVLPFAFVWVLAI